MASAAVDKRRNKSTNKQSKSTIEMLASKVVVNPQCPHQSSQCQGSSGPTLLWKPKEQLGLLMAVHAFDTSATKDPDVVDWDKIVKIMNSHKVADSTRQSNHFQPKLCKLEYAELLKNFGDKITSIYGDETKCALALRFFQAHCEIKECSKILLQRKTNTMTRFFPKFGNGNTENGSLITIARDEVDFETSSPGKADKKKVAHPSKNVDDKIVFSENTADGGVLDLEFTKVVEQADGKTVYMMHKQLKNLKLVEQETLPQEVESSQLSKSTPPKKETDDLRTILKASRRPPFSPKKKRVVESRSGDELANSQRV